tara:strand:+ start:59 stop:601 length:543 start_codon:yes stop_codon:yes gene_type:complete
MREIEGIEQAAEILRPHMEEFDQNFEIENENFKALLRTEHDDLGRILKSHLIIESYMDRFLTSHYGIDDFDDVRLSFAQKIKLLPTAANAVAFVKPGIKKLNTIRNRFGHNLDARVEMHELGAINDIVDLIRPTAQFYCPVEKIEAFTTIACTWMIITPPELQELFMQAFSSIRVRSQDL